MTHRELPTRSSIRRPGRAIRAWKLISCLLLSISPVVAEQLPGVACLEYSPPEVQAPFRLMCHFMPHAESYGRLKKSVVDLVQAIERRGSLIDLAFRVHPARIVLLPQAQGIAVAGETSFQDLTKVVIDLPDVMTTASRHVSLFTIEEWIPFARCLYTGATEVANLAAHQGDIPSQMLSNCARKTTVILELGPFDGLHTYTSSMQELRPFLGVSLDPPGLIGIPGSEATTQIWKRVHSQVEAEPFESEDEAQSILRLIQSTESYFDTFCSVCIQPTDDAGPPAKRFRHAGAIDRRVTDNQACICCLDPSQRDFPFSTVLQSALQPPPMLAPRSLNPIDVATVNHDLDTRNLALVTWPTSLTNMLTSSEIFSFLRDVFEGVSDDVLERREDLNLADDDPEDEQRTEDSTWKPTADLPLRRFYLWTQQAKQSCRDAALALRGWSSVDAVRWDANVHTNLELEYRPPFSDPDSRTRASQLPMQLLAPFSAFECTILDRDSLVALWPDPNHPDDDDPPGNPSRFPGAQNLAIKNKWYLLRNANWFKAGIEGEGEGGAVPQRQAGVNSETLRGSYGDSVALRDGVIRMSIVVWFDDETDDAKAQQDYITYDAFQW